MRLDQFEAICKKIMNFVIQIKNAFYSVEMFSITDCLNILKLSFLRH